MSAYVRKGQPFKPAVQPRAPIAGPVKATVLTVKGQPFTPTPIARTGIPANPVATKPTQVGVSPGGVAAPPVKPLVGQPPPFDPQYDTTVAGANRDLQLQQQGLLAQRQGIEQNYGFVDLSNPFSQAAALSRSLQQNMARTMNSAGNDIYSSSYQRNQDQNRYGFEQQTDQARRAYQAELAANTNAGTAAANTQKSTVQQAYVDKIGRIPRAEDPAPAGATGTPTNNSGVNAFAAKGAVSAVGLGSGKWWMTFSDGRTETTKVANGKHYVLRGGTWKFWY